MQLRDACVITLCKQSHPGSEEKMQIAANKAAMLAVR
jgi:hypothetical protein